MQEAGKHEVFFSTMKPIAPEMFGIILLAVIAGVVGLVWSLTRSHQLLQNWADDNMFQLIDSRVAIFNLGPFFWTTRKGQTVYRVEVEDRSGRRFKGWVRCGNWLFGLLSDQVEVRWQGPGPESEDDRWLDPL